MTSTTTDRRNGLSGGLAIKVPVRVATTANITLSGLQTIDGVALAADDRVLVKNQTTASENGIYDAAAGTWTRSVDANDNRDWTRGTLVLVTHGTLYAEQVWELTAANPITVDTTSLTFATSLTASMSTLSFLQSGTGAVARTALAKMREPVTPADFGAIGDSITDDTAAFTLLEAAHPGREIDLAGLTYTVTAYPTKCTYINGKFEIAKSTTINGVADPYDWYAGAGRKNQFPSSINILRDVSAGLANRNYLLTQVIGLQSFAFDEKSAKIYTLHVNGAPEVSYISEYAMAGGTAARAATGVSNSNAQLGHQGLAVEYLSGSIKLWGAVRYDVTNFPNGHRQVMRFTYNGNAVDISAIESFTLFGSEFSYTGNDAMPAISYCGRFLVAVGRKTSRDFWIRVFDLPDLVAGGAGDYSDKWLYQFNVQRDLISDDTAANFRPCQGIACDGASIYLISGNSALTAKRLDRYSLDGRLEQSNNSVTVGLTEATADGTFYEPEGLAIYKPNNMAPPCLVLCIVSAGGGAHNNRLWVVGSQATISEERETLKAARWTPTATLITNAAAATPSSAHYQRVGNFVSVAGRITIDPTSTGLTVVELTPPIASNFSSLTDAVGCLNSLITIDSGAFEANTTNDTFSLSFVASDTANRAFYYSGMYEVK